MPLIESAKALPARRTHHHAPHQPVTDDSAAQRRQRPPRTGLRCDPVRVLISLIENR